MWMSHAQPLTGLMAFPRDRHGAQFFNFDFSIITQNDIAGASFSKVLTPMTYVLETMAVPHGPAWLCLCAFSLQPEYPWGLQAISLEGYTGLKPSSLLNLGYNRGKRHGIAQILKPFTSKKYQ